MNAEERIAEIKNIIRVWQQAPSLRAACLRLGMYEHHLTARVSLMRLRGVPLKYFGHTTKQLGIDWKELARYAKRFS